MVTLENEILKVEIKTFGAEVSRIFNKQTQLDYLFDGNPKYWNRQSPILFPFVGRLKDEAYHFEGQTYPMGGHGFARDQQFELIAASKTAASFKLTASEKSLAVYPFEFTLILSYEIKDNELKVFYEVENPSENKNLYFSIGGHPAFKVPLEKGLTFTDYNLKVAPTTLRKVYALQGPLVDLSQTTEKKAGTIPLNYEIFKNDAVIFETKEPQEITLYTEKSSHGLTFTFSDFDFVGFWTPYKKDAPFLCIEPWCGIADTTVASGNLKEKFGVHQLAPGENFKRHYQVSFY